MSCFLAVVVVAVTIHPQKTLAVAVQAELPLQPYILLRLPTQ
jgi:hypothetical protein